MKKFKIKSFCKINLSLKILERLNNSYHNIRSFITFCNLFDIIKIHKIKGSKDKISFSGKFKNNINIKSNTVTKVLSLLRKEKFLKEQAFNIEYISPKWMKDPKYDSMRSSYSSAKFNTFWSIFLTISSTSFRIIIVNSPIGFAKYC